MSENVIGIDVGGTNIRIGAVGKSGELVAYKKFSTSLVLGVDEPVTALCELISSFITEERITDLGAVALGFPSTINKERTEVLSTPNIKGLDNIKIPEILEDFLNVPVFLEKDVAMLFYNDVYRNNVTLDGVVVGCYFGTGIGNVISVDGKLLIGKDGAACEIGHIPIYGNNKICGCGNKGCIETIASGRALEKLAVNCSIKDVFLNITGEINQFVDNMAIAVATEINILNPDVIILGGGVLSMNNFPKELLEERIYFHARKPLPADNLKYFYSKDEGMNGVFGAAYYARLKIAEKY